MHRVCYSIITLLILSLCVIEDVSSSDNYNLPCIYSENGKNISVASYERGCVREIEIPFCCPIGFYHSASDVNLCSQKYTSDIDKQKVQDNIKSLFMNKTIAFRLVHKNLQCTQPNLLPFTINNVSLALTD